MTITDAVATNARANPAALDLVTVRPLSGHTGAEVEWR